MYVYILVFVIFREASQELHGASDTTNCMLVLTSVLA